MKINIIKTITAAAMLLMGISGASAQCAAPCTITQTDIMGCWVTTTYTAPVRTFFPDLQEALLVAICNGNITGCPENPAPAPKKTTTVEHKKYTCQKYSIGGSAEWEVFGLTASASTEQSETWTTATTLELTGWCQRQQLDVAKRHVRDTVTRTRSWDTRWWCYPHVSPNPATVTITLDTFTLFLRSDDSVTPPGCTIPDPCKSGC